MGTQITPALNDIVQEEVETGASVSEATFTKIGGSINFLNNYWYHSYTFNFLGPFRKLQGGEDGIMIFPFNAEVVAVTGRCRDYGTSGSTVLDLHKITNATDNGSVLSTKITLTNAVSNGFVWGKNYITNASNSTTGVTLPAFSNADFNAFQGLRLDIDSNASNAEDLTVNIWFRAR